MSRTHSFEPMEAVLARAGSLGGFLAREDLIEQYFLAAQAYHGCRKFVRPSFDLVMSQLRGVLRVVPDAAERLWEPLDPENWSFSLTCNRAIARDFSPAAWLEYLSAWEGSLEKEVAGAFPLISKMGFYRDVRPRFEELRGDVDGFERELRGKKLAAKKRRMEARSFFLEVQNRPELKRLAAAVVWHGLNYMPWRALLLRESGDLLLQQIRFWREHPLKLLPEDVRPNASALASMVRERIPKLEELKARKDIFPKRLRQTRSDQLRDSVAIKAGTYEFQAVPRRFHAIFRGIAVQDCLGGADGESHPARWGVAAVKDARTIHITANGHYHGLVQVIPSVRGPSVGDNETWGLLEFWSPLLGSQAVVEEENGERIGLLASEVIRELSTRRPSSWKGLCCCDRPDFDTWRVYRNFENSHFANLARELGEAREFGVRDDLASKIATALPRDEHSEEYPEGLIHPACYKQADGLPMLGFS